MAFDLNKNDGTVKGPSAKTPASGKFDLSKGEPAAIAATEHPSPSKSWMIGILGVLIIGAGIWYYSARQKADTTSDKGAAVKSTAENPVAENTTPEIRAIGNPAAEKSAAENGAPENTVPENSTDLPVAAAADNSRTTAGNNQIPATFGQGSAAFSQLDRAVVKQVVAYLASNPSASIYVNGYASSDGPLMINQKISQARATAFKRYLRSKNIAGSRIVAIGKGIENPVASNDTDAGRKKNRRVEVIFP